jgi:hypothetical protein
MVVDSGGNTIETALLGVKQSLIAVRAPSMIEQVGRSSFGENMVTESCSVQQISERHYMIEGE